MSTTNYTAERPLHTFCATLLKSNLLAKLKLLGLAVKSPEKLEVHELCDIINTSPKISEYPIGHIKTITTFDMDKEESTLLAQAIKYRIPFSYQNPNYGDIQDQVEVMIRLEKRATDLGVYWDFSHHDPIGLEEAIEDAERKEIEAQKALHRDYNSMRL